MQTFHSNICDLRETALWRRGSEFTVSVPFHRYPLVVPNSPGLCLPCSPFSYHLSSVVGQRQRTGSFCPSAAFLTRSRATMRLHRHWSWRRSGKWQNMSECEVRGRTCSRVGGGQDIHWHHRGLPRHPARCRPLPALFMYASINHCNRKQHFHLKLSLPITLHNTKAVPGLWEAYSAQKPSLNDLKNTAKGNKDGSPFLEQSHLFCFSYTRLLSSLLC